MNSNIQKLCERDVNLTEAEDRARDLEQKAGQFEETGEQLVNKIWWHNCKIRTLIWAAVFFFIVAVILFFKAMLS